MLKLLKAVANASDQQIATNPWRVAVVEPPPFPAKLVKAGACRNGQLRWLRGLSLRVRPGLIPTPGRRMMVGRVHDCPLFRAQNRALAPPEARNRSRASARARNRGQPVCPSTPPVLSLQVKSRGISLGFWRLSLPTSRYPGGWRKGDKPTGKRTPFARLKSSHIDPKWKFAQFGVAEP
jgi:hypothetical protein